MTFSQTFPFALLGGSILSCLFSVMSISVVFWVTQSTDNDDTNFGLFLREATDGKDATTKCVSDMPDLDCGYLNSSKACGVIATLFGGFFCITHLYWCFVSNRYGIVNIVAGVTGSIQTAFGIMCLTIFSYFKNSYLNPTDDINVEYPNGAEASYSWAFYLMITSVILSGVTTAGTIFLSNSDMHGVKRTLSSEAFLSRKQSR